MKIELNKTDPRKPYSYYLTITIPPESPHILKDIGDIKKFLADSLFSAVENGKTEDHYTIEAVLRNPLLTEAFREEVVDLLELNQTRKRALKVKEDMPTSWENLNCDELLDNKLSRLYDLFKITWDQEEEKTRDPKCYTRSTSKVSALTLRRIEINNYIEEQFQECRQIGSNLNNLKKAIELFLSLLTIAREFIAYGMGPSHIIDHFKQVISEFEVKLLEDQLQSEKVPLPYLIIGKDITEEMQEKFALELKGNEVKREISKECYLYFKKTTKKVVWTEEELVTDNNFIKLGKIKFHYHIYSTNTRLAYIATSNYLIDCYIRGNDISTELNIAGAVSVLEDERKLYEENKKVREERQEYFLANSITTQFKHRLKNNSEKSSIVDNIRCSLLLFRTKINDINSTNRRALSQELFQSDPIRHFKN